LGISKNDLAPNLAPKLTFPLSYNYSDLPEMSNGPGIAMMGFQAKGANRKYLPEHLVGHI